MFTKNFFIDNSQLGFGKHITKPAELSSTKKKEMKQVLDLLIKAKNEKRVNERKFAPLAFTIGLMISLSLIVMAFEWNFSTKNELANLGTASNDVEEFYEIPPTLQPPPPPPPKMQTIQIVEVPDIEEIEDEIQVDLDVEINDNTKIEEVVYEAFEEIEEEKAEQVFLIVEQAPTPKGGMDSFYAYAAKNLKYPHTALNSGIGGKVYVQFVVNKEGIIEDVEVVKGIGFGCDDEAARIVRESPAWNAGKQRGIPVNVRMVIPIYFVFKGSGTY